jgi:hypothetical protein
MDVFTASHGRAAPTLQYLRTHSRRVYDFGQIFLFKFGPAEWVWRSLTNFKPQPLSAAANHTRHSSGRKAAKIDGLSL